MELDLTPDELGLVLKLAEANDSGGLDRRGRLGGVRLRVSLMHKLYVAKDALSDADELRMDDEESD